jgi:hypothetical protein
VTLYHPRNDRWADHFAFRSARIVGLTARGRATIAVLQMNHDGNLAARRQLIADGWFPH